MFKFLACFIVTQLLVPTYGHKINPRIINGALSNASDYRFFVQVSSGASSCGGTLISVK